MLLQNSICGCRQGSRVKIPRSAATVKVLGLGSQGSSQNAAASARSRLPRVMVRASKRGAQRVASWPRQKAAVPVGAAFLLPFPKRTAACWVAVAWRRRASRQGGAAVRFAGRAVVVAGALPVGKMASKGRGGTVSTRVQQTKSLALAALLAIAVALGLAYAPQAYAQVAGGVCSRG